MFLALPGCGGGDLLLVSYPSSDSARDRLVAGAKSLGCDTRDGEKNPRNLSVSSCKKYPDRVVLLMPQGEGWMATCSNASDEECAQLTDDLISAAH